MIVGVPVETYPGERRVALVPAVLPSLKKAGLEVLVQPGAGTKSGFLDTTYVEYGVRLAKDRHDVFASADIVVQVRGAGANPDAGRTDIELLRSGQVLVGQLNPLGVPGTIQEIAKKSATAFALELVPRVTRAQSMDVLSSMATIAGYKAALLGANSLHKMFPMLMTAAGTVTPARVFVLGTGVAGLQAISTARRLGAVVHAYDIRPVAKAEVESLGGRFVELPLETKGTEAAGGYARVMDEEFYQHQREMMARVVAESDVVITTAAVPGRKAPILITKEMVSGMRPGSVIVDLAAEMGGNCELTQPGETIEISGITIIGPVNVPSMIPHHASQMYGKNIAAFVLNLVKEGQLRLNLEDPIIRDTLLTHQGEVVNQQVRERLGLPATASGAGERSSH